MQICNFNIHQNAPLDYEGLYVFVCRCLCKVIVHPHNSKTENNRKLKLYSTCIRRYLAGTFFETFGQSRPIVFISFLRKVHSFWHIISQIFSKMAFIIFFYLHILMHLWKFTFIWNIFPELVYFIVIILNTCIIFVKLKMWQKPQNLKKKIIDPNCHFTFFNIFLIVQRYCFDL